MRTNWILFVILGVFFFLADALYITWSVIDPIHGNITSHDGGGWSGIDPVGALGIGLAGVLSFFLAFFLWRSSLAQGGELPEDRMDATIEEGDAEQGFFSPWSWWPILLAGSAGLMFLGLAVGVWVCFIGGAVVVVSLVGWQYEYYRGYHAH